MSRAKIENHRVGARSVRRAELLAPDVVSAASAAMENFFETLPHWSYQRGICIIMALPYQCLAACTRPADDGHEWVLYGASGSQLVAQTSAGATSVWTVESPEVKVRLFFDNLA